MKTYAKAIVGGIIAGLGALQVALDPIGDEVAAKVTGSEWIGVAIAAVITFGGVFGVSNSPSA